MAKPSLSEQAQCHAVPAPDALVGDDLAGLDIGAQMTSDTTVLWVRGEIDMLTLPQLSAELAGRLHDGAGMLILDLQDVTFLSARGLSVLLLAADQARKSGITLRTLPSRAVLQVATLLGLAARLNLVAYVDGQSGSTPRPRSTPIRG